MHKKLCRKSNYSKKRKWDKIQNPQRADWTGLMNEILKAREEKKKKEAEEDDEKIFNSGGT